MKTEAKSYYVCLNGLRCSGMGRNKGTWDSAFNTLATAKRHAKALKHERPMDSITVETLYDGEVWTIKG
jgi:hypothetical protein